jgi:protein OS-9
MTMTDSIMFVKETKTCHYILVVNTPRLCGEPGFKSRIDRRDETLIRCRQVVDAATLADADSSLPESNHPFPHRRASVINPPPPLDAAEATSNSPSGESDGGGNDDGSHKGGAAKEDAGSLDHNALLRRALETILQKAGNPQGNGAGAGAGGGATAPRVVVEEVGDGEMMIEFISEIAVNDEGDVERRVEDLSRFMDSNMFEEALRAAGFDVRDEEVEVEVEMEAERDEEGRKQHQQQRQRGERTVNGAAKGRLRAHAHPGPGPGRDEL